MQQFEKFKLINPDFEVIHYIFDNEAKTKI